MEKDIHTIWNTPIDFIRTTGNVKCILILHGIHTYGDLAQQDRHNVFRWVDGVKSDMEEILSLLRRFDLTLEMTLPDISTVREVWVEDEMVCTKMNRGDRMICYNKRGRMHDADYYCYTHCTAFAIKDGCAICKMMNGDQVIGRIVKTPQEKK